MQSLALLMILPLLAAQDKLTQDAIRALVEKLGSDSIEEREQATLELTRFGAAASPELEEAVAKEERDVVRRATGLLQKMPAQDRYRAHLARSDKKSGSARYRLGEYCMRLDLLEEAVAEFEVAGRLDGAFKARWEREKERHARVLVATARRHVAAKRYPEALALCRLIGDKMPDVPVSKSAANLVEEIRERRARDESDAQTMYKEGWELYYKKQEVLAGEKRWRECMRRFSHTTYMNDVLKSGKSRLDILRHYLGPVREE